MGLAVILLAGIAPVARAETPPAWTRTAAVEVSARSVAAVGQADFDEKNPEESFQSARARAQEKISNMAASDVTSSLTSHTGESTTGSTTAGFSRVESTVTSRSSVRLVATACQETWVDRKAMQAFVRCRLDRDELAHQLKLEFEASRTKVEGSVAAAQRDLAAGNVAAAVADFAAAEEAMRAPQPDSIVLLRAFVPDRRDEILGATAWEPEAMARRRRQILDSLRLETDAKDLRAKPGEPMAPIPFRVTHEGRAATDLEPEVEMPPGSDFAISRTAAGMILAVARTGRPAAGETPAIVFRAPARLDSTRRVIGRIDFTVDAGTRRLIASFVGAPSDDAQRLATALERAAASPSLELLRPAQLDAAGGPVAAALREGEQGVPRAMMLLRDKGEFLLALSCEQTGVEDLSDLSAGGTRLMAAGLRTRLVLWNLATGSQVASKELQTRSTGPTAAQATTAVYQKAAAALAPAVRALTGQIR